MIKANPATNAGVHNANGIEFQKHCAIHILLSRFPFFNGRKYFISIEHHDDLIFCLLTPQNEIETIEAYQAKKANTAWTTTPTCKIIKKLTQTGLDLFSDPHVKTGTYHHTLHFITNDSIVLKCGTKPKAKETHVTIDAINDHIDYPSIVPIIQKNVLNILASEGVTGVKQLAELQKINLTYIDFPKRHREQIFYLRGLVNDVFSSTITDPKAALDTIFELFRNVENSYNNGNIAKLLDPSKHVTSSEIQKAFSIITTKTKAFNLWRKKEDELCEKLNILVFDRTRFGLQFQNSIDLFKDIKQAEHKKILKFVFTNRDKWNTHFSEVECIVDMLKSFRNKYSTTLSDLDLKAAVCAAYVVIKD